MAYVRTMEFGIGCRLSPADTSSRDKRKADRITHLRPSSTTGRHSVWCDLILVEVGYRPLESTNVVLVVTDRKVLLRVVATGFVFTVYLQDIVQVRHVVPAHAVELHVVVPSTAVSEERHLPELEEYVAAAHRLYRVYPKERGRHCTSLCAELFLVMAPLLPPHAQQVSEESDVDDAFTWYERIEARSLLPGKLQEEVGMRELERISNPLPRTPSSGGVARLATTHTRAQQHSKTRGQGRLARSLASSCRGFLGPADLFDDVGMASHLRRIYVVPSPDFWRLSKGSPPSAPPTLRSHEKCSPSHLHHDASAGVESLRAFDSPVTTEQQHTSKRMPKSHGTFFATSAPVPIQQTPPRVPSGAAENERSLHRPPCTYSSMRGRALPSTANTCSLHPFTVPTPPLPASSSARPSWLHAQQPVNLEYGPTASG
ncbi:hypothetical protein LSCM1_04995 [Leishmania martiniquensis]|uniref:Uncharacterized protein n=1 Tax=Leishmania martiniquensis TaxID=1580590 RepID=A0A836GRM7_9TRYP|nr:hypothetical protein LSCM1_04995 [Leishmania martiniquensis]